MGQTKVDLHHLLEDLRDAYPGSPEVTILTEIVANSLDSGARRLSISIDAAGATFTVVDDGSGMRRRALASYHDVASSTKTRGQGIGFAGVGIKLALLLSHEVYTETRRGAMQVATRWHLASRHRAPWKWVPPIGLVAERGTSVCIRLSNVLSPLLDPGFVDLAIRRHFETLLDPTFDAMLATRYDHPVTFELNRIALERHVPTSTETAPIEIRLARRRRPSAFGRLSLASTPLPEEDRGVAVSTLGKVIKRGWDWLGLAPSAHDRASGLIEIPELAACLTLNKSDFIRSGSRGVTYLAFRKAIQEVVSRQLALWGDTKKAAGDARRKVTRPIERDLERILLDLATEFPLLAALVEHRAGGQRKLPLGEKGASSRSLALVGARIIEEGEGANDKTTSADSATSTSSPEKDATPPSPVPPGPEPSRDASLPAQLPAPRGPKRPQRYGLVLRFESRPDDVELGRLVDSTIWINEAHPAHRRAAASRSEGYHLALTVAMALAPLAVDPSKERAFVTSFLSSWGEEVVAKRKKSRRKM